MKVCLNEIMLLIFNIVEKKFEILSRVSAGVDL